MTNLRGYENNFLAFLRIPRLLACCALVGVIGSVVIRLSSNQGSNDSGLAAMNGIAVCALLILFLFLALSFSKRAKNFFMKNGKNYEEMNTLLKQPITIWITLSALAILLVTLFTYLRNDSNKSLDTTRAKLPELWTQQGEIDSTSFTTGL